MSIPNATNRAPRPRRAPRPLVDNRSLSFRQSFCALAAVMVCSVGISTSTSAADFNAASGAPQINACELLKVEQIARVVEREFEPTRQDGGVLAQEGYEGSYSSTCVWQPAADGDGQPSDLRLGGSSFVMVTVISWPQGGDTPRFLQSFRDAAQSQVIPAEPIALAIGDEALWWGDGVAVRKRTVGFGVSVRLSNDRREERQMAERLATTIAAQL